MVRPERHRVFVLGAGVSASCGIAVARDILRLSILNLESKSGRSQTNLINALLAYLYPSFNRSLKNYPNVEDFLNLIEMAKKFNSEDFIESNVWPTSKLQEVMDNTIKAITDYIWSQMGKRKQQAHLSAFVQRVLRPGDTIVSFNWDISLEQSLRTFPRSQKVLYT